MSDELVVCPFCPLNCDNIPIRWMQTATTGCAQADARIKSVISRRAEPTSDAAIATSRQWVSAAKQITIGGTVADIETSRVVSDFVRDVGAQVHVQRTNPSAGVLFSSDGGFITTWGEVAAQGAAVWVIGDVKRRWPKVDESLSQAKSIVRWSESNRLGDQIAAVRQRLKMLSTDASAMTLERGEDECVSAVLRLIADAKYLVVLVAPLHESISRSLVTWSSLSGLVRDLNKATRAAVLTFDPSITLRSVMASRLNPPTMQWPTRTDSLRIVFTPWADDETDSLWLNEAGQTETITKTITIGVGDFGADTDDHPRRLHLAAGTPGFDHRGVVIRGDGSVALPLQQVIALDNSVQLPTPGAMLRRLW